MKLLSLLVKPVSGRCNMRCRYCFYHDPDAPDAGSGNGGVMSMDTLETLVRKSLAYPEEACTIGFQGGEPTLAGLDFFRSLIDFEKQYNTGNLQIIHTLQTNGLTLDPEWAEFLAKNGFLTSVSLDAGKQLHDQMRPDDKGKDTHNRVVRAIRLLEKHGAEYNIQSVVTRAMARHPDKTYRYFKDHGFRHIQFIPCQEPLGGAAGERPYSLDAAAYGKFLCRVFDLWHADFVDGDYYSIRMFDNYVHMLAGHPPEICSMAGRCQAYLLVEADGEVFPCDFYAVEELRLGNIGQDDIGAMLEGTNARRFVESSTHVHEDCLGCEFFFLCRGGCRRDREPAVDGLLGKNAYCESYRTLFEHALPKLKTLSGKLPV